MNPYLRLIRAIDPPGVAVKVDVYEVLVAFQVTNPALQHAAKKILCAGQRGSKDRLTDLREAVTALTRAIEMEESR